MEFIIVKKVTLKDAMKHYIKKICRKTILIKLGPALILLILIYKYILQGNVSSDQLRERWLLNTDTDIMKIMIDLSINLPKFSDFIHPNRRFFHLYRLPKLMKNACFKEMTSANPDAAHPLAPDFSFHLNYHRNKVKIFQDTNPGCIYRIYILPPFTGLQTKIEALTPKNLSNLFLEVTLDDVTTTYSLTQMLESLEAPFLSPLSSRNKKPLSGIGSYTPFCYSKNAVIHYIDEHEYPKDLLNLIVECVGNELKCPIKQYSAVSYMKLAANTEVNMKQINDDNLAHLSYLAKYFDKPDYYGPHGDEGCNLLCELFHPITKRIKLLNTRNDSRVVVSILLTSLNITVNDENKNNELCYEDWNNIFLVVYTDDSKEPQIEISIGILFAVKGIINDFKSAAYGRTKRYCNFHINSTTSSNYLRVGYFYLPIPYWRNIRINLEYRGEKLPTHLHMCYQVLETGNLYNERDTGYLHGRVTFHSEQTDKWREVLTVSGGRGHLVSLGGEINNLKPKLDGPLIERWAALQADPVIYTDYSKSPQIRGTGLEDYFSFSHGFAGAENTTYSFVGVPYGFENKTSTGKSWSFYRHHVLDPIVFDESLEFVMEGTNDKTFFQPATKLTFDEYRNALISQITVSAYTSFFYFNNNRLANPMTKLCDEIKFCDNDSLISHHYRSDKKPTLFKLENIKYLGDSKHNVVERNVCVFSYVNNTAINFRLKVPFRKKSKLILTRKYHSNIYQWNDRCLLTFNDNFTFEWLFAMGPTNNEYSLQVNSVILSSPVSDNVDIFDFKITVLSEWRDVSYTLCSISD